MKILLVVAMAGLVFTACGPARKLPATTTVIDTKPKVVEKPVVTEKPAKPVVSIPNPNPNIKMAGINGRWKFESSSERDLGKPDMKAMPELSFNEADRKVSGTTGCNTFNGFFFTTGELFNFSPLAVKMKRCADVSVEMYITGFYKMVGSYKTDGNKVYLYHKEDKNRYLVFTKIGR